MKKIISIWFIILSTVFAQSINTQGVLRDANGYALDDGTYELIFRIYDAETGGTIKWTDNYSTDVINGVFNATLGDASNPVNMLEGDASYWMSIEVGSDGEMSPRLKLNTSAYEMAYLSGAENVFPGAGNVGIGTTNPSSLLHMNKSGGSDGTMELEGNGAYLTINGRARYATLDFEYNGTDEWRIGQLGLGSFNIYEDFSTARVTILNGGNVGVGTTMPGFRLDVDGRARIRGDAITGGGAHTAGIWFSDGTTYDAFVGMTVDDSHIWFFGMHGANWGLVMDVATGNVGIGTTNPSHNLHINGTGTNNIRMDNATANNAEANEELNSAPNETLLFGGIWRDRIYFYWKDDLGNKYVYSPQGSSFSGRSDMGGEGVGTFIKEKVRDQEERIAALEAELTEIKALLQSK